MLHLLDRLLRKKGTLELLFLFAVIVVSGHLVSPAGGAVEMAELKTLNAKYHCVSGKIDNIKEEGQAGEQDVTVASGQTMVKHKGTPKDTFRAMVRDADRQLDYELVADYEKDREENCGEAIEGLVVAEGCRLVGEWQRGKCVGRKCTGGRLRVACKLSKVQTVQEDSGPTGYSVTDVTVWSSEGTPCLSVSAKFANTEKNFCYLVLQSEVPDLNQIKTVNNFTGRTTTASTTEATTTGTTATKTTTEKTTSTETNTATEVVSTMTTGENNTTAETTTTEDGTTETATQGTTAKPTNTDEPATGPTTKDPAGFRLAWYYWMIIAIAVVVVVLVGLGAWAYFWHRHRRANRQKDEEELLGSDHKQSGSGESDGKSAEGKTKKAVEEEDAKDDGHEQVKSGSSHYFTKSVEKSEVSGEKGEETTKATQRVSIIVPDSSSLSEAPEKKKSTTDGVEKSKESGEKEEKNAKKEGTAQDNGYEQLGSTLLGAAGIGVGIPPTESASVSEVPAKKETTDDGYEKLDDVV